MTTILVDLEDSGKQPLVGYILVTLDHRLNTDDGRSLQPYTRRYELDGAGKATLDLEPSDVAKISYNFQVYTFVTQGLVTVPMLVDDFHAIIPPSLTPILWTDLSRQTGITKDDQDASLLAVVRRLLTSTDFWIGVGQNTFKVKGEYSASAYYSRGDIVTFNGNGYMNISAVTTTNTQPEANGDNSTWRILVRKGATGAGTTGDLTPYNPTTWVDAIAPARSAVKDVIQTLATKAELSGILTSSVLTGQPTVTAAIPANENSARLASTQWTQALVTANLGNVIPTGTVVNYAGTSAPNNWLLCDGRLVSRTTFAKLFAIIGTTYNTGGEPSTDFRIPDLRGRTTIAPDNMGVNGTATRSGVTALNVSGGVSSVALSVTQMPAHRHNTSGRSIATPTLASGSGYQVPVSGNITSDGVYRAGNFSAAADGLGFIETVGGGQAHENMPPYLALNYIIYCGV